jgi:hypothetical protein
MVEWRQLTEIKSYLTMRLSAETVKENVFDLETDIAITDIILLEIHATGMEEPSKSISLLVST